MRGLISFDKNLEWLDGLSNSYKTTKALPRVIMAIGPGGCGKTELAKLFASRFSLQFVSVGKSTEEVRKIVQLIPLTGIPTLYVMHLKDMHGAATNSLLKVLEETPQQSYFWLEVERKEQTIPTIISRSVPYTMPVYTPQDLSEVAEGYSDDPDEWALVPNLVTTPGRAIALIQSGKTKDIHSFVDKIVDNCTEVSTGNALKISDKIKFKDDEEGYDLAIVLDAMQILSLNKYQKLATYCDQRQLTEEEEDKLRRLVKKYQKIIRTVGGMRSAMDKKGVNKKAVFDEGILRIRRYINK